VVVIVVMDTAGSSPSLEVVALVDVFSVFGGWGGGDSE